MVSSREEKRDRHHITPALLILLTVAGLSADGTAHHGAGVRLAPASQGSRSTRYDDLVTLFADWRRFQRPTIVNGVPDYTAGAMAAQYQAFAGMQARLAAIDPGGWPIPQQADYHVVRAEMNGFDFDHRVLKPWASNPAFYVTIFPSESDQPAREGPFAYGSVELWSYRFPLSADDARAVAVGVRAVPGLLAQARTNLAGC